MNQSYNLLISEIVRSLLKLLKEKIQIIGNNRKIIGNIRKIIGNYPKIQKLNKKVINQM